MERWVYNQYPPEFKALVMAWHNMHGLVESHKQDAQNKAMEKAAKR